MMYERVYIDVDKLKSIIKSRGLRERDFCVMTWGNETHRTVNELVRRPNITIETAMKICNTLSISLDELFNGSDKIGDSPNIIGEQYVVNSPVVNMDPLSVVAENKALKLVLKEKDERISDLKKVNDQLNQKIDFLLGKGQNSDS